MKKLITSLYIFIRLYLMGYSWSGLYDRHAGFYRLNYEKGNVKEYAVLDIDFSDGKEWDDFHSFSHIHGGTYNKTLFRVDNNEITEPSKISL